MKVLVGWATGLLALVLAGCGGGGGGVSGGGAPYGLDGRVAPSGIQIPIGLMGGGTQVSAVDAFPRIRPQGQTFMTSARDGTNRLFVTDRNGVIQVFDNRPDVDRMDVFMDLSARVDDSTGENGMLGLVFDPRFSSNRRFYVSYVYVPNPAAPDANARTVRLSRFTANAEGTSANPSSEVVLYEYAHPAGAHFGGWIGFGPEAGGRTLYLSTGDGENPANVVQDPATPFGKVLRCVLNSDGSRCDVPSDNPSFGTRTLTWAIGFRNPWRCSFDRAGNGDLWCGDVGESAYEEVNLVRAGRNYGWPYCEGPQTRGAGGQPCSSYEQPVHFYAHDVGVAVIGGYVYRGSAMPSMVGRYLYTDFQTTTLWSLQANGTNTEELTNFASGLTYAMGEDDNGEVYALAGNGTMFRFEIAGGGGGANPAMPQTLSATGLFTDLAQLTPAPGMVDYELNSPLWSDGALKRRWVIVPDGQSIGFSASDAWSFPIGSITVKHFELPLAAGGTTRLETRVMVHRANGWTGYTYRWRSDQSDAELLTSGASASYETVNPATNAPTRLTWNFPSQAQCMNCHTEVTGRVLGLNARQLNRSHAYATTGRSDNQLRTLNFVGLFTSDIGEAAQYAAMPNPADTTASLESRAKAYLDINCAVCHQPNGPTPTNMDLRYVTSLAGMNILGVPSTQSSGTRLVGGSHSSSDLWVRASSTGTNRMPPLGVQLIDTQALEMLAAWIDGIQ